MAYLDYYHVIKTNIIWKMRSRMCLLLVPGSWKYGRSGNLVRNTEVTEKLFSGMLMW